MNCISCQINNCENCKYINTNPNIYCDNCACKVCIYNYDQKIKMCKQCPFNNYYKSANYCRFCGEKLN